MIKKEKSIILREGDCRALYGEKELIAKNRRETEKSLPRLETHIECEPHEWRQLITLRTLIRLDLTKLLILVGSQ